MRALPLLLLAAACRGPTCDGLFRDRCFEDEPVGDVPDQRLWIADWSAECSDGEWRIWAYAEGRAERAELVLTDGLADEVHDMPITPDDGWSYAEVVVGDDRFDCGQLDVMTFRVWMEGAFGEDDCLTWGAEPEIFTEQGCRAG